MDVHDVLQTQMVEILRPSLSDGLRMTSGFFPQAVKSAPAQGNEGHGPRPAEGEPHWGSQARGVRCVLLVDVARETISGRVLSREGIAGKCDIAIC